MAVNPVPQYLLIFISIHFSVHHVAIINFVHFFLHIIKDLYIVPISAHVGDLIYWSLCQFCRQGVSQSGKFCICEGQTGIKPHTILCCITPLPRATTTHGWSLWNVNLALTLWQDISIQYSSLHDQYELWNASYALWHLTRSEYFEEFSHLEYNFLRLETE